MLWHGERKTNEDEWSQAVRKGNLVSALKAINPGRRSGPWNVLCDNESFLRTSMSMKAYRRPNISLVCMPARSPDFNPVGKMWGWVRKQLRTRDLSDLAKGALVPEKVMYRERVKKLSRTQKTQRVAKNFATNFRTVCKRVVKAKGAAVKG